MTIFLGILIFLLVLAVVLGIWRGFSGPSHLDRVLALDYLSIVGIGIVILLVVATGNPLILDVGICLALIGFLTAYVFAKFSNRAKESCHTSR